MISVALSACRQRGLRLGRREGPRVGWKVDAKVIALTRNENVAP